MRVTSHADTSIPCPVCYALLERGCTNRELRRHLLEDHTPGDVPATEPPGGRPWDGPDTDPVGGPVW